MSSASRKSLALVRRRAAARQRWLCCYCCLPMWEHDKRGFARSYGLTLREAIDRRVTAEHIVARTDGGTDDAENIAAACLKCNSSRHAGRSAAAPCADAYLAEVMALT